MAAKYYWTATKTKNHSEMVPESFRALIIGQSGSGKTSIVLRMLLEDNLLDYNKLFVFGKSLHQPEYKILKAGFENGLPKSTIVDILKHNKLINELEDKPENVAIGLGQDLDDTEKGDISCEFYEDPTSIPDPKDFDKQDKNLIIFDDIMTDKNQSAPGAFFTRSRHNNIDCIYISQNYYHLPRHTIRTNSNFLVLFNLDPTDTDHLYRDSGASVDFKDINKFRDMCNKAWKRSYGYLVIDKSKKDLHQKYRYQLELNKSEQITESIMETPENIKKTRAIKHCELCNITILSSSHAKHIKSKDHLKKAS
jgi:GTPase SAR1 family protein